MAAGWVARWKGKGAEAARREQLLLMILNRLSLRVPSFVGCRIRSLGMPQDLFARPAVLKVLSKTLTRTNAVTKAISAEQSTMSSTIRMSITSCERQLLSARPSMLMAKSGTKNIPWRLRTRNFIQQL